MDTAANLTMPIGEGMATDSAEPVLPMILTNRLRLARQYIAQAADSMRDLNVLIGDATWTEYAKQQSRIAAFVEDRYAALDLGQRTFLTSEQFQRFSTLLEQRRDGAHLSRRELASRAGLSARTIKNIESLIVSPARDTVDRLLSVPELALGWQDVLGAPSLPASSSGNSFVDSEYNCYIPHGYDPVRMVQQLARTLNGQGGHVEQTHAYLEHRSAMAYLAMCHDAHFVSTYRAKYPLDTLAHCIVEESGQVAFKVIALGAGDGHLEVRFVQHLLTECRSPDIELVLFDISQPLLNTAYQHAIDTLGEQPGVHTLLVHGNFHDLPRYPQVSYAPTKGRRRRIYTMLGYTLANLDNEPRFFQHSLSHCRVGDFLVLDFQQRRTPIDATSEQIRRHDPGFSAPFPKAHAEWIGAPIRMHCQDLISYEFNMRLDTEYPVIGSYAVDAVATVRTKNQPERRFSMFRFKRYDEEKLTQSFARFGWEKLASFAFGVTEKSTVTMLLVKRSESEATPP